MHTIIANQIAQCNKNFNQKAACAPYAPAKLTYVCNLINASHQIEMHPTVFGLFHVIAETCLTYSKGKCYKRQCTLGFENKHKPIGVRQTHTHQITLIGLGMIERDNRNNKRLPYECMVTDLGIVHFLIKVKKITNPKEIAIILGKFRKLPVENYQNCRSQEDQDIKDIKKENCTNIEQEKEAWQIGLTPLEAFQQQRQRMRV